MHENGKTKEENGRRMMYYVKVMFSCSVASSIGS